MQDFYRMSIKDLVPGSIVFDESTQYNGSPIHWIIIGNNHYQDNENPGMPEHITLYSEKILSLKAFDAMERDNININRRMYGNNRYSVSNIRQWLNSDKLDWYIQAHEYDAPPVVSNLSGGRNPYFNEPGFLFSFSKQFKERIIPTNIKTALTNIDGAGGYDVDNDKLFLLSRTEINAKDEVKEGEGIPFSYFKNNSLRMAAPTPEVIRQSSYKHVNFSVDKNWYYWLRSPHYGRSNSVRNITSMGVVRSVSAKDGFYGIRPALNIRTDIEVVTIGSGRYKMIYPDVID